MCTNLVTRNVIGFVDQQIERQSHRNIGFQRRVHRDQRALRRLVERRLGLDHAIDDRFAVFGLADLKVRIFVRRSMKLPAE